MSFVLPGLCGVGRFPVRHLRKRQVLALPGSGRVRGDVVSWLAGSLEGGGGMSSAALTGEAPSGLREVELSIQGMTCAARVEKKINTIENVFASLNFATEKSTVTMPVSVAVQELIEKIVQAGYDAVVEPASGAAGGGPDDARVAYLRRRLIVAPVFFVPLSDLSVLLSLFPAYRFPGWQWVLVVLAAPVAIWAAWPFHRAALKNAGHGVRLRDSGPPRRPAGAGGRRGPPDLGVRRILPTGLSRGPSRRSM
jgi:hypothetical protein